MNQTIETQPRFTPRDLTVGPVAAGEPLAAEAIARPRAPQHSLFERFAWLYVFFREKLFRDDTKRIVAALWGAARPREETEVLELGCGPGFYSCGIAQRFPEVSVIGVDRAAQQLRFATQKARRLRLANCRFESDNVLALSYPDTTFDVVISARLFTILPDPKRAVAEMYRVLKNGGRCLVAEPRYAFWASIPLFTMWLVARLTGARHAFCEPRTANVLDLGSFEKVFFSQAWAQVKVWRDGRYQYALCERR